MRRWHRWIGTTIGLFVAAIALSGVLLQTQFLTNDKVNLRQSSGVFCAASAPAQSTSDLAPSFLPDEEIPQLVGTVVQAAQKVKRGAQITSLRLEMVDDEPQARLSVTSSKSPEPQEVVLNARTGEPVEINAGTGLTAAQRALPVCAYGFDADLHQWLLDFHTGHMFGDSGKWLSLLVGIGLTILSITGLMVYIGMFVRRMQQLNKRDLFWK